MTLSAYRDLWRIPAVRQAVVLGALGKAPWFGASVVLTLHVVGRLGESYSAAGLVAAVFTIAVAISSPWRGRLLDAHGVRRTLLPSLAILPVAFFAAAFAPYWLLLAAMGVVGLFSVPWFTLTRAVVLAAAPVEQHRTALALDSIITELAFMVGPTAGVLAAVWFDTRIVLVVFAWLSVAAAAVLWWRNPAIASDEPSGPQEPGQAWVSWRVVAVFLATAAATFILAGTDLAIVASVRSMDAGPLLGLVMVLWSLGSLLGGLLYGITQGHRVPLTWLVLALGATTIPVGLATNVWVLGGLVAICGFFCAPSMAAAAEELSNAVPEARRGEALGWQGTFSTLGNAVAPPVVGLVIDHAGWGAGFAWTGVLGIAAALAGVGLTALGRRVRRALASG